MRSKHLLRLSLGLLIQLMVQIIMLLVVLSVQFLSHSCLMVNRSTDSYMIIARGKFLKGAWIRLVERSKENQSRHYGRRRTNDDWTTFSHVF